jgi:hypothetical protein
MANTNLAGSGEALDTSLPTVYSEFRMLRDEMGVCRKVSSHIPLPPHTGASKHILNYGRIQAFDLQDGVDMVNAQTLADTDTSYTPGEVGLQIILPKTTLRRISDPDLLKRTGRMMANAYDLKEDGDGTAQFSSFTPVVGTSGTVITLGALNAARSKLRVGNSTTNPEPAPPPWFAVIHPLQTHVIGGRLVPLTDVPVGTNVYTPATIGTGATRGPGSSSLGDEYLRKGPDALGRLFGVEVYEDANIAISSNDASGAMFSREGFIFCEEMAPKMESEADDKSLRALELNLVGSYVWGLYRPSNYGVELLFSATLPTG